MYRRYASHVKEEHAAAAAQDTVLDQLDQADQGLPLIDMVGDDSLALRKQTDRVDRLLTWYAVGIRIGCDDRSVGARDLGSEPELCQGRVCQSEDARNLAGALVVVGDADHARL